MATHKRSDRCCNPLDIENHRNNKGLRPCSASLCQTWNLTTRDFLCSSCRKKLSQMAPKPTVNDDNLLKGESDIDDRAIIDENDSTMEVEGADDMDVDELSSQEVPNSNEDSTTKSSLSQLSKYMIFPYLFFSY